jgi:hypothetical protein
MLRTQKNRQTGREAVRPPSLFGLSNPAAGIPATLAPYPNPPFPRKHFFTQLANPRPPQVYWPDTTSNQPPPIGMKKNEQEQELEIAETIVRLAEEIMYLGNGTFRGTGGHGAIITPLPRPG